MNVAQLKHDKNGVHVGIRRPTFPRSNERGSIEADFSLSRLHRVEVFPRSNERGSIEARQSHARRAAPRRVPTFE